MQALDYSLEEAIAFHNNEGLHYPVGMPTEYYASIPEAYMTDDLHELSDICVIGGKADITLTDIFS